MKIAHITYQFKPLAGGLEIYLQNLYKIFQKHGHKQKVYQINNGEHSSKLRLVNKIQFIPGHLSMFIKLFFLKKELTKFDLLIIHFAEFYYPLRWHKNTLVLSHGATWTAEKGIKQWIRKLANQYAVKHSNKYVFNDTYVPRQLGLQCKPQKKMFAEIVSNRWFIPNCVDTDKFQHSRGIEKLKKLNPILVPRNLTYQRGIDLAIRAFAKFNQKYPQTNLVIIGDIITKNNKYLSYQEELKNLINQLEIKNKVHFWGNASHNQMPDIYSSSLMTLIPTRCSEGTSLSALESMACQTATISTNVEGLLDLPTVHCKATSDDLAKKMLEVFPNREKIAQEQYQEVKKIYNFTNWQKTWLKAI